MTNSVSAALTFLYDTLTADATLMGKVSAVYRSIAPSGATPNWVILQEQASPKTLSAFGVVIMTRSLYQVKVVGPDADYANISSAYDRILTLIGLVRSTSGILACYQEGDMYTQEPVAGVQWANLGGLFRIEL